MKYVIESMSSTLVHSIQGILRFIYRTGQTRNVCRSQCEFVAKPRPTFLVWTAGAL